MPYGTGPFTAVTQIALHRARAENQEISSVVTMYITDDGEVFFSVDGPIGLTMQLPAFLREAAEELEKSMKEREKHA
jgi:hypothetical protein